MRLLRGYAVTTRLKLSNEKLSLFGLLHTYVVVSIGHAPIIHVRGGERGGRRGGRGLCPISVHSFISSNNAHPQC